MATLRVSDIERRAKIENEADLYDTTTPSTSPSAVSLAPGGEEGSVARPPGSPTYASRLLGRVCNDEFDDARKAIIHQNGSDRVPTITEPAETPALPEHDDIETPGEAMRRTASSALDSRLAANARLLSSSRQHHVAASLEEDVPSIKFIIDAPTAEEDEWQGEQDGSGGGGGSSASSAAPDSPMASRERVEQGKNQARSELYRRIAMQQQQKRVSEAVVAVLGRGLDEEDVRVEFGIEAEELRYALAMVRRGIIPAALEAEQKSDTSAPSASQLTSAERTTVLRAALDVAVRQGNAVTPDGAVLRPRRRPARRAQSPPPAKPASPTETMAHTITLRALARSRSDEAAISPPPPPPPVAFANGAASDPGVLNIERRSLAFSGEVARMVKSGVNSPERRSSPERPIRPMDIAAMEAMYSPVPLPHAARGRDGAANEQKSEPSRTSPGDSTRRVPVNANATTNGVNEEVVKQQRPRPRPRPQQAPQPRVHVNRHGSISINAGNTPAPPSRESAAASASSASYETSPQFDAALSDVLGAWSTRAWSSPPPPTKARESEGAAQAPAPRAMKQLLNRRALLKAVKGGDRALQRQQRQEEQAVSSQRQRTLAMLSTTPAGMM